MSPIPLRLRATTGDDLAFVLKLQADPGSKPFIISWSRHWHEQAQRRRRGAKSSPACPDCGQGYKQMGQNWDNGSE